MQNNRSLPFFGRLLISIIFIIAGIAKIVNYSEAELSLEYKGISPAALYIFIALVMELVGGTLLLLGWFTRVSCWILLIFLVPTTLIFHSFWLYDGAESSLQLSMFLKNLAIFGGLLLVLSFGPGEWSIDAHTKE